MLPLDGCVRSAFVVIEWVVVGDGDVDNTSFGPFLAKTLVQLRKEAKA